jgi:hypothetical protein
MSPGLAIITKYVHIALCLIRSHRKESLLYFVQCIFLLFSAVYISKEALERVLMSSAGSEGGHSHGHSHGGDHSEGYVMATTTAKDFAVDIFLGDIVSLLFCSSSHSLRHSRRDLY